jgi:flavin reductase (DIM6/NTAB) family NADH-FMN oxidoreductase RutF
VLCFPSEEQAKDAWFCGRKSGRELDKFQHTAFKPVHSRVVKPPIIDGVTVAYECSIVNHIDTGDHTMFIADVVAIHGEPENTKHLYSIHYTRLISLDCKGNIAPDLKY